MRRFDPPQLLVLLALGAVAAWGFRLSANEPVHEEPEWRRGDFFGGPRVSRREAGRRDSQADLGGVSWVREENDFLIQPNDGSEPFRYSEMASHGMSVTSSGKRATIDGTLDSGRRVRFTIEDYDRWRVAQLGIPLQVHDGDWPGAGGQDDKWWWIESRQLVIFDTDRSRRVARLPVDAIRSFEFGKIGEIWIRSEGFEYLFPTNEPQALVRAVADEAGAQYRPPRRWSSDWRIQLER